MHGDAGWREAVQTLMLPESKLPIGGGAEGGGGYGAAMCRWLLRRRMAKKVLWSQYEERSGKESRVRTRKAGLGPPGKYHASGTLRWSMEPGMQRCPNIEHVQIQDTSRSEYEEKCTSSY